MQNTRHAVLRPYLSANCPTKYPDMPPERKPVVKSAATISSLSPNWSLYKLYTYGPAKVSLELGVERPDYLEANLKPSRGNTLSERGG